MQNSCNFLINITFYFFYAWYWNFYFSDQTGLASEVQTVHKLVSSYMI